MQLVTYTLTVYRSSGSNIEKEKYTRSYHSTANYCVVFIFGKALNVTVIDVLNGAILAN